MPAGYETAATGRRTRSSTQVTQAEIDRGAEHVEADQDDGEVGEVLHEADGALGDLDAEQHGDGAAGRRVAADGHQREQQAEGEPDEQEDQVGVELAQLERVEAVALGRPRRRRADRSR